MVTTALQEAAITHASLLPTALRILGALKSEPRPVPAAVGTVLDYVPAAISHVDDDLVLSLPDPNFTDHIRTLTADQNTPTTRPHTRKHLPERPAGPHTVAIVEARRHPTRGPWIWG